jgi:flagellar hook-associated protein 2
VLTSRTAGTAEALTVTTGLFTTAEVSPASNAQIMVDGFTYTGTSNTVTGALDGVTLNLTKDEIGKKITLDVTSDQTAASEAIQNLVRAYNAVVGVVKKHASYDAATQTGGALMGDIAVRSAMQQIRNVLGGENGEGSLTMLSQLGVKTATDGTMTVDSSKLGAALSTNAEAVRTLFSGADGIGEKLSEVLDGYLDTDGRLSAQTERLQARLTAIGDQTEALDRRMALVEARYRKQFTALDTLLGQLQSTSSYLTQQLSALPGSG